MQVHNQMPKWCSGERVSSPSKVLAGFYLCSVTMFFCSQYKRMERTSLAYYILFEWKFLLLVSYRLVGESVNYVNKKHVDVPIYPFSTFILSTNAFQFILKGEISMSTSSSRFLETLVLAKLSCSENTSRRRN